MQSLPDGMHRFHAIQVLAITQNHFMTELIYFARIRRRDEGPQLTIMVDGKVIGLRY